MKKTWNDLSELPCVKKYGWRHKIGHILGTHNQIKCIDGIAQCATEGFAEGIKRSERRRRLDG